jgi:SAM-dependent methyltransferase
VGVPPAANSALAGFYAEGYTVADPEEAQRLGRWRALGARGKAEHAVALCARAGLVPGRVVEIDCGDGALLAELSRRALGRSLDGFELSAPAAAIARTRAIPRAGRIEPFDGLRVPAADSAYELAVVSHVLEHVPDPPALLAEARRLAPWVLVEVPLEANRSARRPAKRAEAARIGHLHALSRPGVRGLLARAGLEVVAELTDPLPLAHHAFFARTTAERARAALKAGVRHAAWRAAPDVAARLFTLHYAVLARRGPATGGRAPA